ncbi:hypothetical protein H6P81_017293 [Aristolochia fimbriata]|uniref:WRC domain-containing protein n=1 Tax=Aristolochia fimbriata TaxID=158543 RepID=A0AAV7DY26_ARIFI|nr:hypothetical protein H6P81_017293 [Aristolochia fimbriata]
MRIRKFAKLAAAVGGCGGGSEPPTVVQQEAKVETNVCELNRSPWDVMTFLPQSHVKEAEDEEDEERDDRGTVRVARGSSRKIKSREAKEAKMECRERERTLCRKSGSKGWKCGKEAKQGHSLCDHHLELNRCYRYESCRKPVPAAASAAGENRRSRCKRPSFHASVSDFYYYSGFGPRWRRRRRGSDADDPPAPAVIDDDEDNEDDDDDDDVDEEQDDAHEQQQEVASGDVDNTGHDDYEDDDDDDVDDADYGNRARKPRKARSLKSLCSETQTETS